MPVANTSQGDSVVNHRPSRDELPRPRTAYATSVSPASVALATATSVTARASNSARAGRPLDEHELAVAVLRIEVVDEQHAPIAEQHADVADVRGQESVRPAGTR